RRHRHARLGLPDRPDRQPVAPVLLLRPARTVAALPALRFRQPAVRADPVHSLLRPGLGCDRAADRAARSPSLRPADLRHRLRVDLCCASARRRVDRVRGRRGAYVLRRLSARVHELGLAVPPGRGIGPADRARTTRPGGGTRTRRRGGGPGLLLTLGRQFAVAVVAIAALLPEVALAHAQLLLSDPAPGAVVRSVPPTVRLVFTEPVTPAGTGIKIYSPSGRFVAAGVLLLVLAEPVSVVGQLASLAFDGDTALAVLGSSFGRLMGLRLGAALLAWTLIATARSWPMLAVGGAVAMLDGAGAHA